MGQKEGKNRTTAADSQPMLSKFDRLVSSVLDENGR
jgi:hypothetical protein